MEDIKMPAKKNEYEQRGADLRSAGKSKPTRKWETLLTSKAEVRARDDKRIGWEKENKRRKAESKKKS